MSFEVLFTRAAARDLQALAPGIGQELVGRIRLLAEQPRPAASKELSGDLRGVRSLRVREWRIAYVVDDAEQTVEVWRIGNRRGFYDRLRRSGA